MAKKKSIFVFFLSLISFFLFTTPLLAASMLQAPEMLYPQNNRELNLEEAYVFKVKPIAGASGYLFGLFQDGVMVYENYRDTRTLSPNGEFALAEDNPVHALFHSGEIKVMIRALVQGRWTEARELIIILKPRSGQVILPSSKLAPATVSANNQISSAATDSSALQKQIDDLQKKLEQSQQRQSALEQKLNEIMNWIKSFFPVFK